jgi:endonuclease/exonuclease/phosphatase family metal-dependent hydrolase
MRKFLTATLTAAAVSLSLSVVGAAPASAATAAGTFSVLSYNVGGLPEVLSSATTSRATATTAIGQRLGAYDVIHVQEDFNYHANLYAADKHQYRTATSGGAAIGSGLNSMSNPWYDGDDFERVRWNSCQFDSGDCYTPKGFTFMRERLAEGVFVDFYNVHTNAGVSDGDQVSRADNLSQLTAFIRSHSAGNAVVVMGDTNTRYTRSADTIAQFVADNGLTDAWVKLPRGGVTPPKGSDTLQCDSNNITNTCEVVDKILYRGNRLINLDATYYNNEHAKFLESGTGLMLSDHDPVTVKFSWSTNPAYTLSDQTGGPHGNYYTDLPAVPEGAQVAKVSIRTGVRVEQVGLTLTNGTTLTHGGTGGTASSLTLADGEYVDSVYMCRAPYSGYTRLFYVSFATNLGHVLAGGSYTSDCSTYWAPSGWQIAGFHGRAGDAVDKLGVIYTPKAVKLVNRATGKCLEVLDWSTADTANVIQWSCQGGANQRWRIEPLADGTSRLINLNSGKALDVHGCGTADGTDIEQYAWWNNACERWALTSTDSGYVRLQNPNSGKVADVADCDSADGTDVRLWTWLNNNCQQWIAVP